MTQERVLFKNSPFKSDLVCKVSPRQTAFSSRFVRVVRFDSPDGEETASDLSDSDFFVFVFVLYFSTVDIINLPATSLETHFLKKIDVALPADYSLCL